MKPQAVCLLLYSLQILSCGGVRSVPNLNETGQKDGLVSDLQKKFERGELLVHMKRDFANPERGLARWQGQGALDPGLSFSLIHPQMALQQLWVNTGYLFDGSMCEVLAGCMSDIWVNNEVQHGAENVLSTLGGRRAELLRLMWLRHMKKKGNFMHVAYPHGFREFAVHPGMWSKHEVEVFTMENPFDAEDTIKEVPTAEELGALMDAVDSGSDLTIEGEDWEHMAANVVQDYNSKLRTKFSEILSICPLSSLQGFVYSLPQAAEEDLPAFKASMHAKGRAVLQSIRNSVPALASQPMVVAEYSSTTDDDLEEKVSAVSSPSSWYLPMDVRVPVWKEEFLAKLTVVVSDPGTRNRTTTAIELLTTPAPAKPDVPSASVPALAASHGVSCATVMLVASFWVLGVPHL